MQGLDSSLTVLLDGSSLMYAQVQFRAQIAGIQQVLSGHELEARYNVCMLQEEAASHVQEPVPFRATRRRALLCDADLSAASVTTAVLRFRLPCPQGPVRHTPRTSAPFTCSVAQLWS